MTRNEHIYRRIRSDSNNPEFDELSRREMIESPFKFMLISVCYPMIQVLMYILTGDPTAFVSAIVLFFIWIVMLACFIGIFKAPEDIEDEIVESWTRRNAQAARV
jgi:hypothetical protein